MRIGGFDREGQSTSFQATFTVIANAVKQSPRAFLIKPISASLIRTLP